MVHESNELNIEYPIHLIPHGGGYLSFVNPDDESEQMLVVCGSQELALQLIQQFELLSAPKSLNNDREFVWLLRSLKQPVNRVAFDPNPEGEQVNARQVVAVVDLLQSHLQPDLSPWNYPVYAVANDQGFVSINTEDETGEPLTVLCFFSQAKSAEDYLNQSGQQGEPCAINDVLESRAFLLSVDKSFAAAVALNPRIEGERHTADYCFSIEVLLEKYLVAESTLPSDSE